jgi:sugar phosphate isomerase/epimerase
MGWTYTLKLIENVPGLKLVFDTGNPVFADDCTKPEPYPKQSSWEFYSKVREHVAYIHIKDGLWDAEGKKAVFTFPGEGHGDVKKIMKDLMKRGYAGGVSMEPHLAVLYHDPSSAASAEIRYGNYVEYGRQFEKLLAEVRKER